MMKKIFLISITISLTICCSSQKQPLANNITCVEGINIFPIYNPKTMSFNYDTGLIRIYIYKEKLYLYEWPLEHRIFDSTGNHHIETKTHYFVFQKDSAYGYKFDSTMSPIQSRVSMDSVFKMLWLTANQIYPAIASSSNSTRISYKKETLDSLFIEYEIKEKSNPKNTLNLKLDFAKENFLPDITLSKELDSLYNMKLVKYISNYTQVYIKEKQMQTATFSTTNSLKQLNHFDDKKAIRFFSFLDPSIQKDASSQ